MDDVPTFVLAARFSGAMGSGVIRVYLDREFLMREQKLCEQGETTGILSGLSHQFSAALGGQLGK
jgi:hypothetical protein